ncbi:MAG: ATP-binding protein [Prevotellaceae bacterium]|jgi:predicted ATP-dependent endonuclease of OLD family|nr:ATP-binding protein [Prevotellaceae bacterium]
MNGTYKISTVEISSLWNRADVVWRLNPDVNILSGINGSGKSTILSCIANMLAYGKPPSRLEGLVGDVKITCENGHVLSRGSSSIAPEQIAISYVRTFDHGAEAINTEWIGKYRELICTELDKIIYNLQRRYVDYQLNISKKVTDILRKDNSAAAHESIALLMHQQQQFLEMVDLLFEETGKKIDREQNEVIFSCGKETLTPYQLSSGEKQMLIILLTVLVQDGKAAILLMDEPEISLHFDWQKKLIQYTLELNPNVQIILATHSPAMIMEGWLDKVSEVRDLIQNAR